MENLYNSSIFARVAYKDKDTIFWVARTHQLCVPKQVVQKDPKQKKYQEQICLTTKDCTIEVNDNLPSLLACSVHDIKPVHIFSTVTENITRTTKNGKFGKRQIRPLLILVILGSTSFIITTMVCQGLMCHTSYRSSTGWIIGCTIKNVGGQFSCCVLVSLQQMHVSFTAKLMGGKVKTHERGNTKNKH